jgi:hypothetical protein
MLRSYLFEAAGVLLTRVPKWSALKAWGVSLIVLKRVDEVEVTRPSSSAVISMNSQGVPKEPLTATRPARRAREKPAHRKVKAISRQNPILHKRDVSSLEFNALRRDIARRLTNNLAPPKADPSIV